MPPTTPSSSLSTRPSHVALWAYAGVAVLAILASITGLSNGFALDDLALIADNARVHTLHDWWRLFALPYWPPQHGASLYRPIVALGYALQWTAGNGSPVVFHFVSVALYAATSVLVFALFLELVPPALAIAGAALFAVHPVHVEAVANVVGQSELMAAVTALGASVLYARARRSGRLTAGSIVSITVLFAAACSSKEHALLIPLLLAAIEWFAIVDDSGGGLAGRIRATLPLIIALGIVGVGFVGVRTVVVGGLLGEKHLVPVTGIGRVWVMLVVVPEWIRLLAWPARLSADYSPNTIAIPTGIAADVVLGALILAAALAAFIALGSRPRGHLRERQAARLGLAWMAITLLPVSNLFSVMLVAERTLLMPSVGAMLAVAAVGAMVVASIDVRHRTNARAALGLLTACLVTAGAIRSWNRQRVWRDDATLFAQTVEDAPNSYRAQFFYGQLLFAQGKRAEGEKRLRLAIQLNPTASDVSPLNYLATEYRDAGMCPQALPLYERAIANDAARPDVRYGLAACLLATGRAADARRLAEDGVRRGDLKGLFLGLIASADTIALRPAR